MRTAGFHIHTSFSAKLKRSRSVNAGRVAACDVGDAIATLFGITRTARRKERDPPVIADVLTATVRGIASTWAGTARAKRAAPGSTDAAAMAAAVASFLRKEIAARFRGLGRGETADANVVAPLAD
jgi:hypothetical protein